MTANGPPPLRFYSIVLAVADLDGMRDWYVRTLGFVESASGKSEQAGTAYSVLSGAGTTIELVARLAGPHHAVPAAPPPGHLAHLGWRTLDLETDDMAAMDAYLAATGTVVLSFSTPVASGRRMTLLRDPEGNLIAIFGR